MKKEDPSGEKADGAEKKIALGDDRREKMGFLSR